ncbi:MAG: YjbQ family protein [Luteitalea sp.]|nr:YjbQ family protein [Luteitalea sp.]
MILTKRLSIDTKGQGDVRDVTAEVGQIVADSRLEAGAATVFVVGSTAGVTTLEFESGVVADLDHAFEQIAPRRAAYEHHRRWGDDNGSSHVRAAMLGPSLTIPFEERRLLLGTWQQIVVAEFDTGARRRELVVQVIGE